MKLNYQDCNNLYTRVTLFWNLSPYHHALRPSTSWELQWKSLIAFWFETLFWIKPWLRCLRFYRNRTVILRLPGDMKQRIRMRRKRFFRQSRQAPILPLWSVYSKRRFSMVYWDHSFASRREWLRLAEVNHGGGRHQRYWRGLAWVSVAAWYLGINRDDPYETGRTSLLV